MRTRASRWEKEARKLSVEFTDKAKIMATPRNDDTPTIAESPWTVNSFRPPHAEDERVIRTLFNTSPDPEWRTNPRQDLDIPLPEGYDPEAARRRIRAVGYRYHPPGAPVKGTIRTEVQWSDLFINP